MKLKRILCLLLLLTVVFSIAACKSTKKYTVIFNSDGGSAVSNQIVKKGDTVPQPADPVKEGYTFLSRKDTPSSVGTTVTTNGISQIRSTEISP